MTLRVARRRRSGDRRTGQRKAAGAQDSPVSRFVPFVTKYGIRGLLIYDSNAMRKERGAYGRLSERRRNYRCRVPLEALDDDSGLII